MSSNDRDARTLTVERRRLMSLARKLGQQLAAVQRQLRYAELPAERWVRLFESYGKTLRLLGLGDRVTPALAAQLPTLTAAESEAKIDQLLAVLPVERIQAALLRRRVN